ncbi:hypothetical protein ACQP1U_11710 [Actinomycetota bacterium]
MGLQAAGGHPVRWTISGTKTTYKYYAISTGGYLYRVFQTYDSATRTWTRSVIDAGGGAKWGTVKDISASQSRLYYITSGGELRRRSILSTGKVTSAGTLIRSGLSITQLSALATFYQANSSNVVLYRYDVFLGITRGGALQEVAARYAGTGGYQSRLHTLKSSGWNRFNSIDTGYCGSGFKFGIVARDWSTKQALAYYDTDVFNYSGSDLHFSHRPAGTLPNPTPGL